MKSILGAGGGVLGLTAFIIVIVLRRKRNKEIEKENQRPANEIAAGREEVSLIPNPTFSDKETPKQGVEMLHYPRDCIEHTETLENGMSSVLYVV